MLAPSKAKFQETRHPSKSHLETRNPDRLR